MPAYRPPHPRPRRAMPVEAWLDAEAGPVVRPYVMTNGRVEPAVPGFDLVAFVVAVHGVTPGMPLQPEDHTILTLVARPLSVAEVAMHLDLPIGVVRVLIGDLLADGLVAVHEPRPLEQAPDEELLEAVLEGLRAL